ncbi:MFS transporter [Paeniglutamicibacter kerguelensis]|uniref:MFS family permease n=1 Tax=Paeniglutamicibacter kerguelensis TaxID=254788 RepID=A0ABS4X8E1_9MICC|nr:MFS transporter [Paeniglutamicibacter kerguelensis]MBP2384735.1 MFS family permease [Paeniglutamicibacter kerguelensis]
MTKQPKAVWAVAFSSMIAFMGIGLVSPILPAITEQLGATATQTSLLFTSYLVITGVAMFFTSFISSRIGARRTLMTGLAIIVVASFGAGASGTIEGIIAFRAVWGLGNAMFISTALSTIISESRGSTGAAVILYEAALGLGIAVGPLVGGLLGSIAWQAPFYGASTLMALAFILLAVMMRGPEARNAATSLPAPFKALANPTLLAVAMVALFYNIGFFVIMSFTAYPLHFTAMGIGLVFTGWGLGLAITSVFGAPMLTRRFKRTHVLVGALTLLSLTLVGFALLINSPGALVAMMVLAGLELGIMNTVLTEVVMDATDLPRSVASSSYSGIRFLGGAISPPLAAALASAFTMATPYLMGAASVAVAAVLLASCSRLLAHANEHRPEPVAGFEVEAEAEPVSAGDDRNP